MLDLEILQLVHVHHDLLVRVCIPDGLDDGPGLVLASRADLKLDLLDLLLLPAATDGRRGLWPRGELARAGDGE